MANPLKTDIKTITISGAVERTALLIYAQNKCVRLNIKYRDMNEKLTTKRNLDPSL